MIFVSLENERVLPRMGIVWSDILFMLKSFPMANIGGSFITSGYYISRTFKYQCRVLTDYGFELPWPFVFGYFNVLIDKCRFIPRTQR